MVETQTGEESESTQERDGGLQMGDTGQVKEYYLKEEEVRRRTGKEEEEEEKKIPTSKADNLWKWWRNMWTAPMDIQSNDVKHKAPDETTMPAKEEVVEADDLTLEDGAVQTGEVKKPIKCNICGKRFINNLALEGHMKIHVILEDTYDCHICRQDFKQVLGLTEHVYMHDKGGDHTCPHCQKDFTARKKPIKHIGQMHAKEMFSRNDFPESSTGRDQSSNHVVKHKAPDETSVPAKEEVVEADALIL